MTTLIGKTITANGDVKQILPFHGAGVGIFDGTGDYLSTPANSEISFNSGSWTIECWYNPVLHSTYGGIFMTNSNDGTAKNGITLRYSDSGTLWFTVGNGTTYLSITAIANPSLNVYTHIAAVYDKTSNLMCLYLNGLLQGSVSNSGFTPIDTSSVGSYIAKYRYNSIDYPINGYLSELRISSVARYTGPFTPPKYQFTPDTNTKLLLHFTPTGTTFTDSSPSPKTITAYGDAKQLSSPCGSGIAYFDGSGDYLTVGDTTSFKFLHNGESSYTIGVWIKINAFTTPQCLFDTTKGSSYYVGISCYIYTNRTLSFFICNGIGTSLYHASANYPDDNNWHYIYISMDNIMNIVTIYVDGIASTPANKNGTASTNNHSTPLTIGSYYTGSTYDYNLNGYIGELIIKAGIIIPTAIPTQPFKPDPYTKLLLRFDNWNAPTVFKDRSMEWGNVHYSDMLSGCVSYYNGTINSAGLYQDIIGGYHATIAGSLPFTTPDRFGLRNQSTFSGNVAQYITRSFVSGYNVTTGTIAIWAKSTSSSGPPYALSYHNTATGGKYGWALSIFGGDNVTGNIGFSYLDSGGGPTSLANPSFTSMNDWALYVVTFNATNCSIYRNGVLLISNTISATPVYTATMYLNIGLDTPGQYYPFTGSIGEIVLYNRVLTAGEVQALYRYTKKRYLYANLEGERLVL